MRVRRGRKRWEAGFPREVVGRAVADGDAPPVPVRARAPSRRVPVTASGRHRQRRRHGSGARARQRRPRRGCVLLCSARREESRGIGAWLVWGQGRARARPHRVQVKSPNHFANLAGIIISKHLYTPWCDWFSFLFQTNYSLRP